MSVKIRFEWPKGSLTATLQDTPTTAALLKALPITAAANTWGDEVYFQVPVRAELEAAAQQVVDVGAVCFWVEGSSLALPWGPTPISEGSEPRLVTRCNVLGKFDGDAKQMASVRDGDKVLVTLVD